MNMLSIHWSLSVTSQLIGAVHTVKCDVAVTSHLQSSLSRFRDLTSLGPRRHVLVVSKPGTSQNKYINVRRIING